MRIPTVGSFVKIRMRYDQGPRMIPPQPNFYFHEGKVLPSDRWLTDRQFNITGDKDWPIRTINMINVEDIEIIQGSFKTIETKVKTYEVAGSKGNKYIVTRNEKGWSCNCSGFQFRRQCKHVTELSVKTND
jgi:hypothetical protein